MKKEMKKYPMIKLRLLTKQTHSKFLAQSMIQLQIKKMFKMSPKVIILQASTSSDTNLSVALKD